jgi:hypothetical protein
MAFSISDASSVKSIYHWRELMKDTNIRLLRNLEEKDWSVQINGKLYDHISTSTLDDLLEYTSIAAQQSLLESKQL